MDERRRGVHQENKKRKEITEKEKQRDQET